jgi:pimeloyl-ACP methyl ester carboxylesterase
MIDYLLRWMKKIGESNMKENPIPIFKAFEGQSQYLAAYEASLGLWPVPYTSAFVTTPYGQTHVITCGPEDAFPLVLLHGGYASSTMWFANIADLSAKFRVVAIDTIGEPGKSIPSRPNASRHDIGAWLEQVFTQLGIQKAHVVGLSRGGWLALNFALHAPQRLERVVLLSPAASFISLTPFFQTLSRVVIRIPVRSVLKAVLYSWVTPGFVINDVFERQFVLGLLHWNWAVNAQGYSGVMPSVFPSEELGKLHMPILMLTGDHDKLNPPRAIQRARQMIPHLEAEIIPHAGHLLSMEQPGCVDQRVLSFLA